MHLNMERFGSVAVFRPSIDVELAIRKRARENLFSCFAPGDYSGESSANEVIRHQFGIYSVILEEVMPVLESRGAVDFLLCQYDQASRLLHGNGILDLRERERWRTVEPQFKRAIKYLMERICM